jgi:hypothetical protein
MIINEGLNYTESVQFFLSMRKAVASVVTNSSKLTEVQRVQLKNFIINEASDYEILHLAMKGDLPKDKFNVNKELMLFSKLKEQVLINYRDLSEFLTYKDLGLFLTEVGPIYPKLSTAKPILEFYLSEQDKDEKEKEQNEKDDEPEELGGGKAYKGEKDKGDDDSPEQLAGPNSSPGAGEIRTEPGNIIDKAKRGIKGAVDYVKKKDEEVRDEFKKKQEEEATDDVHWSERWKNKASHAYKDWRAERKRDKENISGKDEASRFKDKKTGEDEEDTEVSRFKDTKTGEEERATDVLHGAKETAKDIGNKMVQKGEEAQNFIGDHAQGATALAATALAGMAVYGATKIYKRFFSQAAKACSGKGGPAKDACMKQFKAKALQAKVQALTRSKATCKKAKNPQNCINAINSEITKARK